MNGSHVNNFQLNPSYCSQRTWSSLDTTRSNGPICSLVPETEYNVEQTSSTFGVYNWVSALAGTLMIITRRKKDQIQLEKDSIKVPWSLPYVH